MTALHWLFPVAAIGAAAVLAALAGPVPRRTGTLALVLTLAALGVAILH